MTSVQPDLLLGEEVMHKHDATDVTNLSGTNTGDVTLGTNTATALSLSGQQLSLADKFYQLAGDVLGANMDFATYKAIAMSCDNGNNFPTSPTPQPGQWFLYNRTQTLFQRLGGAWKAIYTNSPTVYVDYTNGTDGSDYGYGTGSSAYKTITYALSQLGSVVNGSVVVNVGAGTYPVGTTLPHFRMVGDVQNSRIYIRGTTSVNTSISGLTAVFAGSTTSAYIEKTGAGWTPSEFRGKMLKCTAGANLNGIFPIKDNTSDTIYIVGKLDSTTILTTDTFDVLNLDTAISTGSSRGFYVLNNTQVYFQLLSISAATFCIQVYKYAHAEIVNCYLQSTSSVLRIEESTVISIRSFLDVNSSTANYVGVSVVNGKYEHGNSIVTSTNASPVASQYGINAILNSTVRLGAYGTQQAASIVSNFGIAINLLSGSTLDCAISGSNINNLIENCTTGFQTTLIGGVSDFYRNTFNSVTTNMLQEVDLSGTMATISNSINIKGASTILLNGGGDITNNIVSGIYFNSSGTPYSIHRTTGTWGSPNYQQLSIDWNTGVIINPGTAYGKSYLDVTGNGTKTTQLVVNEGGDATGDFRAESDTEANMLFLDANADTDGAIYLGGTTNGIKINKGGVLTFLGTANISSGATGTFTTADAKTVTVTGGIITSIV